MVTRDASAHELTSDILSESTVLRASCPGQTKNISRSGALIACACREPLLPGVPLDLTIKRPSAPSIETSARVVWCSVPGFRGDSLICRIGVRLHNPSGSFSKSQAIPPSLARGGLYLSVGRSHHIFRRYVWFQAHPQDVGSTSSL